MCQAEFQRAPHRVAHARIAVQIDLVTGVSPQHMRDVPVSGFRLLERKSPLHQPSVCSDARTIHPGQQVFDLFDEPLIRTSENLGRIQIIMQDLQNHVTDRRCYPLKRGVCFLAPGCLIAE
jgi:hypothetical protein